MSECGSLFVVTLVFEAFAACVRRCPRGRRPGTGVQWSLPISDSHGLPPRAMRPRRVAGLVLAGGHLPAVLLVSLRPRSA